MQQDSSHERLHRHVKKNMDSSRTHLGRKCEVHEVAHDLGLGGLVAKRPLGRLPQNPDGIGHLCTQVRGRAST